MINEEWLKSLSTEELADYLSDVANGIVNEHCTCPDNVACMGNCTDCCIDWLKQEHKNDKQ